LLWSVSMKVRTLIMAVLLAAAASAPAAWAQRADEPPAPPANGRFGDATDTARSMQDYVYGVIKKISPSEITCDKTEFGPDQAFKLDKKTKFIRDGKPSALGNLKLGEGVWVKIRKDKKTGDLIAVRVATGVLPTEAQ
jgi:hypothetical protein